jgi:uncharacterized protein (TIGR03067 family)
MPIPVVCPSCARKLRAPDNWAGRKTKCPKCGGPVAVPGQAPPEPAKVRAIPVASVDVELVYPPAPAVTCPSCGSGLKAPNHLLGRTIPCPKCGAEFTVCACPGCGRAIPLLSHELSRKVICSVCETAFIPVCRRQFKVPSAATRVDTAMFDVLAEKENPNPQIALDPGNPRVARCVPSWVWWGVLPGAVLSIVVMVTMVLVMTKTDNDRLQGTWLLVDLQMGSQRGEEWKNFESVRRMKWTFKGDKITIRDMKEGEATFRLDSSENPRTIDLTMGGETRYGIYELDGNTLRVCFCFSGQSAYEKRKPSRMTAVNDEWVLTFKRVKE